MTINTALVGARLFDGTQWHEDSALVIEDGHVADIVHETWLPSDVSVTRLDGGALVPGFVDLQVNGGGTLGSAAAEPRKMWPCYGLRDRPRCGASIGNRSCRNYAIEQGESPEGGPAAAHDQLHRLGRVVPAQLGTTRLPVDTTRLDCVLCLQSIEVAPYQR